MGTTSRLCSNEITLKNGMKVKTIEEMDITENLTKRNLSLTNLDNQKKEITQLHFRKWPDHGVPNIDKTFETFEKINENLNEHFNESPVVVHCSAGVGRTGTLMAIFQVNY